MRKFDIQTAFTFDRHFLHAGFRVIGAKPQPGSNLGSSAESTIKYDDPMRAYRTASHDGFRHADAYRVSA